MDIMSTPKKDSPPTIPLSQILVESPAIYSQISTDIVLNCGSLLLPNDLWTERVQDLGQPFAELGSKTYKRNKIMSVGPPSDNRYYYDLTAIAVDLCKIMRQMQELDEGWRKLPKNPTQIKEKSSPPSWHFVHSRMTVGTTCRKTDLLIVCRMYGVHQQLLSLPILMIWSGCSGS